MMIKARTQTCPTLAEKSRLYPCQPGMPSPKQTWCLYCDHRSKWWERRTTALETTKRAKETTMYPHTSLENSRPNERSTLQHLLVCPVSQNRLQQARTTILKAINNILLTNHHWNKKDMEWLNPYDLSEPTLQQLSAAREPEFERLHVERHQ